jgi:formate dehydrogenase maturation protein FdhE
VNAKLPENELSVLEGKPGISPELLRVESHLLSWRKQLIQDIEKIYPSPEPDGEAIAGAITSGQALVSAQSPLPGTELLSKTLTGFFETMVPALPTLEPLAKWVQGFKDEAERDAKLSEWFTASWKNDTKAIEAIAKLFDFDASVLCWAGRQFARPFFHQLATLLSAHPAFEKRDANTQGCPCCGGAPRMGRYEKDEGRRFLWCDLCNIQWVFTRIVCPFCLNRSHEKLGYLDVEGTEQYRIDVCETCRGYLRAVIERDRLEGNRVDFTIEDVGTLYLCFVAERQGYQQGSLSCCSGECACGSGSNDPGTT